MLYCHKHCYITKGTWAIVIEICSFVLRLLYLPGMWALALLLHITQSNRWAWHIVVVLTIALWLFCCCLYIITPLPSCCARIIVLLNCCTSYDDHISNVRQAFSVSILSFLQYLAYFGIILIAESCVALSTIISRSYRAWRRASCVGYYNIIYILFLTRTL